MTRARPEHNARACTYVGVVLYTRRTARVGEKWNFTRNRATGRNSRAERYVLVRVVFSLETRET